jgi:hypothetical protein
VADKGRSENTRTKKGNNSQKRERGKVTYSEKGR